ncbi:predicted protein [Naegleria gruberi]|uniref:Predicted protein n=1 Tax=Naegleria gruberi TaxID=5762 RepID=D2VFJ8_NAEGR|nr:uncharacterized protein NAEGRDRAFT_67651 [Naegleria gruberi]EFC44481.1 predicted protein [Naegleria gruberi]|eukprot:XP_002677225.1 predicted protein [Naegleria gruberi strain NEG-M]
MEQRGKSPRKKKNDQMAMERGRAVSATPTYYNHNRDVNNNHSSSAATTFNTATSAASCTFHEEMGTSECSDDCCSEVIGHFDDEASMPNNENDNNSTNSADFEEQSSSFRRLSLMGTCDDDIMFDSMMYNQSHYYSSFTVNGGGAVVGGGMSSYYSNGCGMYEDDDMPSAPTSLTPSNYSSSSNRFGANSLSSVNNSQSSLSMIGQCARMMKSNVNTNSNQEMRPKSSGSLPTVNSLSRQSYNDQSIAALKDLINVNIGV